MEFIKGFTYGWMSRRGDFTKPEAKESMRLLKERTNTNCVIISLAALQDGPHSTVVDYTGDHMVADEELIEMVEYAQSMDLKVMLKPTVNCKDGTWRAHINFFDLDVPCEPKWKDWFKSYTKYQMHYAEIAQRTNCDMFIVGCEMVQTERREQEWRNLIKEVRAIYKGPITYNTDKYQEGNVRWWDAVDVISSSGYYPIDDWDQQLARIESILKPFNKPFFFAEAGCPSRSNSPYIPNDWGLEGKTDMKAQADYYQVMFEKAGQKEWVKGFGLWDWKALLHDENEAFANDDYAVFGKPAEKVIYDFYLAK
ncbi:glycoside hydrolase family 113 [Metabacillus sp. Hm71]|uniref:glycoside hydrolase family 113 n=1 Tax=Metabacillus sp. Hm71 TaxID=3450743 RepID=UPI003F440DB9